jgi:hypothetical protein
LRERGRVRAVPPPLSAPGAAVRPAAAAGDVIYTLATRSWSVVFQASARIANGWADTITPASGVFTPGDFKTTHRDPVVIGPAANQMEHSMRRILSLLFIAFCLTSESRTCSLVRADMANDVIGSGKMRIDEPVRMIRVGMSIEEINYLLGDKARCVLPLSSCGLGIYDPKNSWTWYERARVSVLFSDGIAIKVNLPQIIRGPAADAKQNKGAQESRYASPIDEKVNRLGGYGGR